VTSSNNPVLQAGICGYGLTTVVKRTGNKPDNIRNLPNSGIHKTKPAMLGVNNSTSLPVISQKPKLKWLCTSRRGPDVWHQILKIFSRTLKNNSLYLHQFKEPTVIPTHLFMCLSPKIISHCKRQWILAKCLLNCTVVREA